MLNEERRTVEEAYQVAGSSSNLRVEADRRTDADVLIAAGWTPGMLGSAALRLRGEWDRSEKPRLLLKVEAQRLAKTEGPEAVQRLYAVNMTLLAGKLKSFLAVCEPLSIYMAWDRQTTMQLIFWWLDQKCVACGGTRWEVVKGTNRHGNKLCRPCDGTGIARLPHGETGRKAANFLDDCVHRARHSIGKRLRQMHSVA